jgi:hypothetical protein
MTEAKPIVVSGAVEGDVDGAVLRRLIEQTNAISGPIYDKKGKTYLKQRFNGYNQAARFNPWIVLVDLNDDADCAPLLGTSWGINPTRYMCFRVAVRAVEAWLFADREHLARFLGVPISRIPRDPEILDHPKRIMVDLASHSRRRDIREDMMPRPKSGRTVGPAYTSRLIEFVQDIVNGWRPDVAVQSSESLARCLRCLYRIVQEYRQKSSSPS